MQRNVRTIRATYKYGVPSLTCRKPAASRADYMARAGDRRCDAGGPEQWETKMFSGLMARAAMAAGVVVALAAGAGAAEVEVHMLNQSGATMMVFEPSFIRIAPGDTVKFIPTDKGHNAETIPGMLPDGAEPFAGKMSAEVDVTFDKPGVYGIRCKPHYSLGMVALVVVGEPVNLDAAKAVKQVGKAKQAFATLFDQVGK